METKNRIEDLGEWELFSEFVSFFGLRRAMELMGYAVLWGMTGVEDVAAYREQLMARGLSRSAAYRATLDFRKFKDHINSKQPDDSLTVSRVIERLSTMKQAA